MAAFGCGCGAAPKVEPNQVSLIDMIKKFENDDVLLAAIEKKPQCLNDSDIDHKTVLMYAVEKGREVVIKKCFENGVYLEATDSDGWTAMMYAARRGNIEICEELLSFGANLNTATREDGFTALHLAAGNELIDVCLALVKAGADPNIKDSDGRTPDFYLKIPKNKEKLRECLKTTYKEGKTADQIHKHRVEAGTEKSVSMAKNKYNL